MLKSASIHKIEFVAAQHRRRIAREEIIKPKLQNAERVRNGVAVLGALASASYLFVVRPWHLHWGATKNEMQQSLPGDEWVPAPKLKATHALTIHAPASEVWQWIAQLGQGRGGFYSYDWIENLMGAEIYNADQIMLQFQNPQVGDSVPLASTGFGIPIAGVEPGRYLLLHGDTRTASTAPFPNMKPGDYINTTWLFFLEALAERTTRLIERWRVDWNPSLPNTFFYYLLLEPGAFIMSRKMLLGIKQRAERNANRIQTTADKKGAPMGSPTVN